MSSDLGIKNFLHGNCDFFNSEAYIEIEKQQLACIQEMSRLRQPPHWKMNFKIGVQSGITYSICGGYSHIQCKGLLCK